MSTHLNAKRPKLTGSLLALVRPFVDLFAILAALTLSLRTSLTFDQMWPLAIGVWGALTMMEWPSYSLRAMQESRTLAAVIGGITLVIAPLAQRTSDFRMLLINAVITLVTVSLLRSLLYAVVRDLRARRGWFTERVGILGTGIDVDEFLITAQDHPEVGIEPVFMPELNHDPTAPQALPTTIVFPNPSDESQTEFSNRLWLAAQFSGRVLIPIPGAAAAIVAGRRYEEVWGLPFACITDGPWGRVRRTIRRAIDVAGSSLLLVACSPLLGLGALAVKLSGPGPVFFRQPRLTTSGTRFEILKFRTMPVITNASAEQDAHRADVISPMSSFLRKTSIDELPQLLNVLKGDMSLIGPRPEAEVLARVASHTVPGYLHRSRARAGMTGLAQVNRLRGETSLMERARFDNLAIDRASLWTDLFVIAPGTFGAVIDSIRHRAPNERGNSRSADWTPGSLLASTTGSHHAGPHASGKQVRVIPAVISGRDQR